MPHIVFKSRSSHLSLSVRCVCCVCLCIGLVFISGAPPPVFYLIFSLHDFHHIYFFSISSTLLFGINGNIINPLHVCFWAITLSSVTISHEPIVWAAMLPWRENQQIKTHKQIVFAVTKSIHGILYADLTFQTLFLGSTAGRRVATCPVFWALYGHPMSHILAIIQFLPSFTWLYM